MLEIKKIHNIFSESEVKHGLSLFKPEEIKAVEDIIIEKDGNYIIKCQKKNKFKVAKPEEIVRQIWIYRLLTEYGYPIERIDVEKIVHFGSRIEPGAADIAIYHKDLKHYYILFETKRPSRKTGLEQLKSYCNAEGAPIGVWSNGNEMIRLHREEPNLFVELPRIPTESETLKDILTERWTLNWLEEHDELKQGKTTLKKILLDLEELVLGGSGLNIFDETFKLIYAKLFDEWNGINNAQYQLDFHVGARNPAEVKTAVSNLLEGAKRTWPGVFEITEKIEIRDAHLKICISFLEKIKLFNSNLQIIDEAFEFLIPQAAKKKHGQFFTPRPVVEMVVGMLNPKANEFVIDPACGSAGFLLHSVMWIAGGVITGKELPAKAKNFAQNNIYGIDFARNAVKISKAINLIVGDGKAHIFGGSDDDDSLAPHNWKENTKAGLMARLLRFPANADKDRENQDGFFYFDFDVLMTNPPFAGTVKERDILRLYGLGEKDGRIVQKTGRHILFLERSLQFIRPGGRMAIVLPQGLLNNTNAEYIRRFFIDRSRILAVVGLHEYTFKPHTGTKTSVLFLQKYTDEEIQKIQLLKAKYEEDWEKYLREQKKIHSETYWQSSLDVDELSKELFYYTNSYFDSTEQIEASEEEHEEESKGNEEKRTIMPLREIISEFTKYKAVLEDKQAELDDASGDKKQELKEEVKTLIKIIKKTNKRISERTIGGKIYLVLNEAKLTEKFKEYWLDNKVMQEIDYPIFFGVNQKPLKNSKGDYSFNLDNS